MVAWCDKRSFGVLCYLFDLFVGMLVCAVALQVLLCFVCSLLFVV